MSNDVNGKFYAAIKSIYQETYSCIKLSENQSDRFQVYTGLRQGDSFSPNLASFYLTGLAHAIKNVNKGINCENFELSY